MSCTAKLSHSTTVDFGKSSLSLLTGFCEFSLWLTQLTSLVESQPYLLNNLWKNVLNKLEMTSSGGEGSFLSKSFEYKILDTVPWGQVQIEPLCWKIDMPVQIIDEPKLIHFLISLINW